MGETRSSGSLHKLTAFDLTLGHLSVSYLTLAIANKKASYLPKVFGILPTRFVSMCTSDHSCRQNREHIQDTHLA